MAQECTEAMQRSVAVSFTPEYERVKASDRKITCLAHLSAAPMRSSANFRPRISLSSVIDKSGSMKGSKMKLVQKANEFVINNLSGQDKLGVVTYDSNTQELIPLSKTSDMFKEEAKRVINVVEPFSSTNLSGGLFMGIEQQTRSQYCVWDDLVSTIEQPAVGPSSSAVQKEDADASMTGSSFCDLEASSSTSSSIFPKQDADHSTAGSSICDLGANTNASFTFSDASMVDITSSPSVEIESDAALQTSPVATERAPVQPKRDCTLENLLAAAASLPSSGGGTSSNFAILTACCSKNAADLKQLLEDGAPPPYFFSLGSLFEGWTPLHFAALHGWTEVLEVCTRKAAAGDARYAAMLSAADRCGHTALTLASKLAAPEPAALLRGAGAAERGAVREGAEEVQARLQAAKEEGTEQMRRVLARLQAGGGGGGRGAGWMRGGGGVRLEAMRDVLNRKREEEQRRGQPFGGRGLRH
eukprot:635494-Rhodomonas_salina.1